MTSNRVAAPILVRIALTKTVLLVVCPVFENVNKSLFGTSLLLFNHCFYLPLLFIFCFFIALLINLSLISQMIFSSQFTSAAVE